jgi:hypothetical protein
VYSAFVWDVETNGAGNRGQVAVCGIPDRDADMQPRERARFLEAIALLPDGAANAVSVPEGNAESQVLSHFSSFAQA